MDEMESKQKIEDYVKSAKEKNRLEDVVALDYPRIPTHGRERKVPETGGLTINVDMQVWHHFGNNIGGDVFSYLKFQHNLPFRQALEFLGRRANLPEPDWGNINIEGRIAARKREDTLEIATQVFSRWFWNSENAQAYAGSRGWSLEMGDETTPPGSCQRARLGYTGKGTKEEREEMRSALMAEGTDLHSPAAVAILGYRGDVLNWAKSHELDEKDIKDDWIKHGSIPGLLSHEGLIYPHLFFGRVDYLSRRGIGENKDHFNIPRLLIGPKRIFINHAYTYNAPFLVIVEGQADAISLAQWGIAAIALCGAYLDDDTLKELKERHKAIYIGLDADVAGVESLWNSGMRLGPMARVLPSRNMNGMVFPVKKDASQKDRETVEHASQVVQAINKTFDYPLPEEDCTFTNKERSIKDVNDLHQAMVDHDISDDQQRVYFAQLVKSGPTIVEVMATWAGAREGYEREEAVDQAFSVIVQMSEMELAHYKTRLSKLMGIHIRDFDRLQKTYIKETEKEHSEGEPKYILGGYIDGYLIEYLFNRKTNRARLCWRDPQGQISKGDSLVINGTKYVPSPPTPSMIKGSVLFPSDLGEKKSLSQMLTLMSLYINGVGLLPSETTRQLIGIWVINSWLYDCFRATSYLTFLGETGSGKSELMFRTGMTAYRPMSLSGANSVSSFFRMVEKYKGTVMIDEADLQQSDTTQDIIKFYNQGSMKGRDITRMEPITLPDGTRDYEEVSFQTFCPKMNTLKKLMFDDAVTSRSIVIKLVPREVIELMEADIPLDITDEIIDRAQAMRNYLVRYRLENWQEEIKVNKEYYDYTISARMNQIAGGLLMLAENEPELQEMIRSILRDYYRESQITKSMTPEARIIEAMWTIYKYLYEEYVVMIDGIEGIKTGLIADMANKIIKRMNSAEDDDGDEDSDSQSTKGHQKKEREMTAHSIGKKIRETLQIETSTRKTTGYYALWNGPRMKGLALRYGLDLDTLEPLTIGEAKSELEPIIDPAKSKKKLEQRLQEKLA